MFELQKDRYKILLESVMQVPFNMLMARSVLSDHVDGKVLVDSCESPKSFYIVHPYGMAFLCGDSNNETFNQDLFDYFAGKSHTRERDEWLQAFPRDWDLVLNPLVDGGMATLHSRLNFKLDEAKFYETYHQTDKSRYEIVPTPTDMLFEISGRVVPKDYWKTPEQLTNMAAAFTVMVDGKPVSTAFPSARHDDKLEIGIETVEEYHGKGLGYLACGALIAYCLENDLEPVWSCRLTNTASVNLCKKLGFTEVLRMPYYHIPK